MNKEVKVNKKNLVIIDRELCKACSLCIVECPSKIIKLSDNLNNSGYHPAEITDISKCIGCKFCAIACPDACIEVYRKETV